MAVPRMPVLATVLIATSVLGVLWLAGPLAAVGGVDAAVLDAIVQTRPPWLVSAGIALSTVGAPGVTIALTMVTGVIVAWRGPTFEPLLTAVVGLCALGIGDVGLKYLVDRTRPPRELWAMPAHGPSFPSGHAVFALGGFLLILTIVARALLPLVLVGAPTALAIGLSRLVVGVHYPSDVLAGWAVAVAAVGITVLVVGRPGSDGGSHGTHMKEFVRSPTCAFWWSRTRSGWPDS